MMKQLRHFVDGLLKRVLFINKQPWEDYVLLLRSCTAMLDTLPWCGFTTSLDALGLGLPVLSQEGSDIRGRFTALLLRSLGLHHTLLAKSEGELLHLAVRLARDPEWRTRVSIAIRAVAPLLFRSKDAVQQWEEFLSRAVKQSGYVI
jgi:predicted O-linked N-acetylglucosamine transferase (SPINDLY family)